MDELKLKAAKSFLLQSPPGEVNDVLDDIRNIIQDDKLLEISILTTLETYNTTQFIITELNGKNILITDASKIKNNKEGRLLDPTSSTSFLFDHIKTQTSSPLPYPTSTKTEQIRKNLELNLIPYVENHYNDGVCSVYSLTGSDSDSGLEGGFGGIEVDVEEEVEEEVEEVEEKKEEVVGEVVVVVGEGEEKKEEEKEVEEGEVEKKEEEEEAEKESTTEPTIVEKEVVKELKSTKKLITKFEPIETNIFGIYLVGNKYNSINFWTGRWRSKYVTNFNNNTIKGLVQIDCHYYEDGNVQLATSLSISTLFPPSSTSIQIISILKSLELEVQNKISKIYLELSEEVYKGLRRTLPKTRSKLDWNKISGYKLGNELINANSNSGVGKDS